MREVLSKFRSVRRIPELDKFPLPLWERVRERGHPPLTPPIKGGDFKITLEEYKNIVRRTIRLDLNTKL